MFKALRMQEETYAESADFEVQTLSQLPDLVRAEQAKPMRTAGGRV
ncbi:hypothetical protein ACFSKM_06865 [Ancylobacter dichloromethanicus]